MQIIYDVPHSVSTIEADVGSYHQTDTDNNLPSESIATQANVRAR